MSLKVRQLLLVRLITIFKTNFVPFQGNTERLDTEEFSGNTFWSHEWPELVLESD